MKMNIFNSVQFNKPKQSRFDLSHDVKMSFQMGQLVPTCVMEALPGDVFNIQVQNMLRMAPMITPVMHRIRVNTYYFFVPNRLLWSDWGDWFTGNLDVQHPWAQFDITDHFSVNELGDYLGYPTEQPTGPIRYNPMPIAAYALIWDEYFRDQNLQDKIFEPLVAGNNTNYAPDTVLATAVQHRAWQHDYFTSCLPFAQKGDDVLVPLTSEQNIPVEFEAGHNPIMRKPGTGAPDDDGDLRSEGGQLWNVDENAPTALDPNGSLVVDVQSDAVTINTLRRAFRLQEWLEKNARGGTRYVENILAHFGVKSSDSRLQRPEYIGSVRQNMVISQVLATAQDEANDQPIGQMAGHGISVGGGGNMRFRVEEHGWIIGIINVQPDSAYQQGLERQFFRFDRFDYAVPTFANLGEQEVLNKEVYLAHTEPDGVFGYNPRYAEYKFKSNRVAGQFKTTLAYWHLGRRFTADPALNEDFIKCLPDDRIFAVTGNSEQIYAHVFNNISAVRKLPKFGIPTI